jgi:hypothetical protein
MLSEQGETPEELVPRFRQEPIPQKPASLQSIPFPQRQCLLLDVDGDGTHLVDSAHGFGQFISDA